MSDKTGSCIRLNVTYRIQCLAFKDANNSHQRDLLTLVMAKHPVCDKCLSWTHKAKECKITHQFNKCGGAHIRICAQFSNSSPAQLVGQMEGHVSCVSRM